jgi:hypothetical protein
MNQMDRATAKLIQKEIDAALSSIALKYGMTATLGTVRFGTGEGRCYFRSSMELAKAEHVDGVLIEQNRARAKWAELCKKHDVDPEYLDKRFIIQGVTYQIVGANLRNRLKPVQVKSLESGTVYAASINAVVMSVARYPVEPPPVAAPRVRDRRRVRV